ncbi:RING finger protein B [Prunus yedoensis var. nudiflora]|uniref:RING finger protein B n=1 Tax=Prunus yedoensis var. nudiflora TaxID=2094558 RepID=A0A314YWC2_PRUYE|nr:RING finger protein B [Prunus yedoensis var. nudiflora]
MRWERISGPGKRWGHTCNAIKEGRLLYVFGGYGKDNCQTNQVHVFDTATHTWSQPVIKGTPPTPRDSHSCTSVGDNLFVFGGTDGMNPLKDLHILDTSSHTWISPSLRGDGPEAREGHSAALVGKRLFIFGGCGKSSNNSDEVYYNDLYILNTETFVWKHATTSGNPPSPRDSHTCSSWKNKIIVIGGEDGHDYYLSDVHILDADTLMWRELNTSGQLLPPRAGHSTVAFGKNLFVFGGFTDAQNLYNDLHMLDVGLTRESERRLEKLSLRKQLKLKCQEQNLTSFHDKPLVNVGTGADMRQPMTVPFYAQPCRQNIPLNQSQLLLGKKTFQAKVTEKLFDGYTIETVIDGKPLRGILFSNKPDIHNITTPNSSRKRAASEAGGLMSNGDYNSKSKTSRSVRQETVEHVQADNVHGKESVSLEQTEAAAASVSKNQAYSDASHLHKVSGKPDQSVTPLNLGDNQTNDASNFNTEVVGEDRSHRTTDAPNFDSEVMKENLSVTENTTVSSSRNQDGRKLTEGRSEATSV